MNFRPRRRTRKERYTAYISGLTLVMLTATGTLLGIQATQAATHASKGSTSEAYIQAQVKSFDCHNPDNMEDLKGALVRVGEEGVVFHTNDSALISTMLDEALGGPKSDTHNPIAFCTR